jgi:hypothetical protein
MRRGMSEREFRRWIAFYTWEHQQQQRAARRQKRGKR